MCSIVLCMIRYSLLRICGLFRGPVCRFLSYCCGIWIFRISWILRISITTTVFLCFLLDRYQRAKICGGEEKCYLFHILGFFFQDVASIFLVYWLSCGLGQVTVVMLRFSLPMEIEQRKDDIISQGDLQDATRLLNHYDSTSAESVVEDGIECTDGKISISPGGVNRTGRTGRKSNQTSYRTRGNRNRGLNDSESILERSTQYIKMHVLDTKIIPQVYFSFLIAPIVVLQIVNLGYDYLIGIRLPSEVWLSFIDNYTIVFENAVLTTGLQVITMIVVMFELIVFSLVFLMGGVFRDVEKMINFAGSSRRNLELSVERDLRSSTTERGDYIKVEEIYDKNKPSFSESLSPSYLNSSHIIGKLLLSMKRDDASRFWTKSIDESFIETNVVDETNETNVPIIMGYQSDFDQTDSEPSPWMKEWESQMREERLNKRQGKGLKWIINKIQNTTQKILFKIEKFKCLQLKQLKSWVIQMSTVTVVILFFLMFTLHFEASDPRYQSYIVSSLMQILELDGIRIIIGKRDDHPHWFSIQRDGVVFSHINKSEKEIFTNPFLSRLLRREVYMENEFIISNFVKSDLSMAAPSLRRSLLPIMDFVQHGNYVRKSTVYKLGHSETDSGNSNSLLDDYHHLRELPEKYYVREIRGFKGESLIRKANNIGRTNESVVTRDNQNPSLLPNILVFKVEGFIQNVVELAVDLERNRKTGGFMPNLAKIILNENGETISHPNYYGVGHPTLATFFPDFFSTVSHYRFSGRRAKNAEIKSYCSKRFFEKFPNLVTELKRVYNYKTELIAEAHETCVKKSQDIINFFQNCIGFGNITVEITKGGENLSSKHKKFVWCGNDSKLPGVVNRRIDSLLEKQALFDKRHETSKNNKNANVKNAHIKSARPFFLQINSEGTHSPWDLPDEIEKAIPRKVIEIIEATARRLIQRHSIERKPIEEFHNYFSLYSSTSEETHKSRSPDINELTPNFARFRGNNREQEVLEESFSTSSTSSSKNTQGDSGKALKNLMKSYYVWDKAFGEILEKTKSSWQLSRIRPTYIVITGDHGINLGKQFLEDDETIFKVPFVMHKIHKTEVDSEQAGSQQGSMINFKQSQFPNTGSSADVFPTIMDLISNHAVGQSQKIPFHMPEVSIGRSMLRQKAKEDSTVSTLQDESLRYSWNSMRGSAMLRNTTHLIILRDDAMFERERTQVWRIGTRSVPTRLLKNPETSLNPETPLTVSEDVVTLYTEEPLSSLSPVDKIYIENLRKIWSYVRRKTAYLYRKWYQGL